jgi:hypothetical protein
MNKDVLKKQIIEVLIKASTGIKAKRIAKILGLDTATKVNSILYSFQDEFVVNEKYE